MNFPTDSPRNDKRDLAEAIGFFVLGEISLGNAAERADVSRWEMESLLEKAGVERRYGPRSPDELADEVTTMLDLG